MIYLDYAAAAPLDKRVLAAMRPFFNAKFFNPSAGYQAGREVRQELVKARALIAKWLGAKPAEIIFTAGATEANNLAIQGVLKNWPDGEVLISAVEHESVRSPARQYKFSEVAVHKSGLIDLADLKRQVSDKTVLISLIYANNEIGIIQPLAAVAEFIAAELTRRRHKSNNRPLYLHTDASQAANYLSLMVHNLGVDLMTLNGSKTYGPKQSGALFVRAGLSLEPLIYGGGQEKGLRSGTEAVAQAAGLAAAIDIAQTIRASETRRITKLRDLFAELTLKRLPEAKINGGQPKLANNLSLTFPGTDNERLLMLLENHGVLAAAGSACQASDEEPSPVLQAIGLSPADSWSSLRFSLGRGTTVKDIRSAAKLLTELVPQAKNQPQ